MNEIQLPSNPEAIVAAHYQSMFDALNPNQYHDKIRNEELDVFANQTANILTGDGLHLSRRHYPNTIVAIKLDETQQSQARQMLRTSLEMLYENKNIALENKHFDTLFEFVEAIKSKSFDHISNVEEIGPENDKRRFCETWISIDDDNQVGIEWDEALGVHFKYKTKNGPHLYEDEKAAGVWQELFVDNSGPTGGTGLTFESLLQKMNTAQIAM